MCFWSAIAVVKDKAGSKNDAMASTIAIKVAMNHPFTKPFSLFSVIAM